MNENKIIVNCNYVEEKNTCEVIASKTLENGRRLFVQINYYNYIYFRRFISSYETFKNGKIILKSCANSSEHNSLRYQQLIKDDVFLKVFQKIWVDWELSEEGENIIRKIRG